MFISSSQLQNRGYNDRYEEIYDLAYQLPCLDECALMDTDPMFVHINRVDRLGQNLIDLREFCTFAEANNIDDAGYAIAVLCDKHNIGCDNIGFFIDEATCYANEDLGYTACMFRENGFDVYLTPISHQSIYYQALQEALELDFEYPFEESYHLLAYCESGDDDEDLAKRLEKLEKANEERKRRSKQERDDEEFFAELRRNRERAAAYTKQSRKNESDSDKDTRNIFERTSDRIGQAKDSIVNGIEHWAQSGLRKTKKSISNIKGNIKNAKDKLGNGIDAISKKLSAAKSTVKELASKVSRTTGEAKAALVRQLGKAKEVVNTLKLKLTAAKNAVVDKAQAGYDYVSDKAGKAGRFMRDTATSAYDATGRAGRFVKDAAGSAYDTVGRAGRFVRDTASNAYDKANSVFSSGKRKLGFS